MKQEVICQPEQNQPEANSGEKTEFVNILRGRTFNDELRSLVEKIRENELEEREDSEEAPILPVTEIKCSENDLLKALHSLFYRTKNIASLSGFNACLNPLPVSRFGTSGKSSVFTFVENELKKISIPYFAILTYDILKKAFSPAVSNLSETTEEDVVISLRGKLYSGIYNKKEGILIDSTEIQSDLFTCKHFNRILKEFDNASIYFILASRFNGEISQGERSLYNDDLSPIFMFICEKSEDKKTETIRKMILERVSFPLYLLSDPHELAYKPDECNNMLELMLRLDFYFQVYSKKDDGTGIVVKSKEYYDKRILIVFKYFYTRLLKTVSDDSFIIRIQKNIILIFTHSRFTDDVKSMVDEYNRLFNNSFSIDQFSLADLDNFNLLIEKIYS